MVEFDADAVGAPGTLSARVAERALVRYAKRGDRSSRTVIVDDFRAVMEVLDEYQAEVEKRLAALEKPNG